MRDRSLQQQRSTRHNADAHTAAVPLLTHILLLPAADRHCYIVTFQTCSDGLGQAHCQVSWGDFCVDPWGHSDRVHDKGCLMRSKSYMYFHMMDQFHCMVTAEGNWAVDYIGRVESANEDWKDVSARARLGCLGRGARV
jgi:hypothetical protein